MRHATADVVPHVERDHSNLSGSPGFLRSHTGGESQRVFPRVPHVNFHNASPKVVKTHVLVNKRMGIRAIFSLAPLPRRPCMEESPCSLRGGVDYSNHQFPTQTDGGEDTRSCHPSAEASR